MRIQMNRPLRASQIVFLECCIVLVLSEKTVKSRSFIEKLVIIYRKYVIEIYYGDAVWLGEHY